MVDLLGNNSMFEPMWDAIRSMRNEGVLSLPTFVSVFGSYCSAGRVKEAIMSFEVMDRYGVFLFFFYTPAMNFLFHMWEILVSFVHFRRKFIATELLLLINEPKNNFSTFILINCKKFSVL